MNIRFFNAKILTMQKPIGILEGQVWVKGNRIVYVGDGNHLENVFLEDGEDPIIWDREIDCAGNLLMPGFKNAHTHSPMVLFRSMADDKPLDKWLHEMIFPIEAKLIDEYVYQLTKLAVLEYLSSGVTSVFDMYIKPRPIVKAFEEMGMRSVHVSGINNYTYGCEELVKLYQDINQKADGKTSNLTTFMMGVHAEYTCSRELLEQVAKLVHKFKSPFFAHLSETSQEVLACKQRYGKTPIQLFDELGLFDYGGGGYHCIYMEEEDYEIFRKKGLTVVTNPASNLKLASGIAPISRLQKEKIPIAIGTDGAGSNNCLDMFREMFLVTGLAKYREQDATSVDALSVLEMATCNGAKAMGILDADVLAKGKLADLILLDLNQPNMRPLNHIEKNIVYSGSKQNVKMTMIDGKILYEDGKYYVGQNPMDIYEICEQVTKKLRNV